MNRASTSLIVALALVLAPATALAAKSAVKLTGVVNLNTATAAELDLLPGVGEKAAKRIIEFRQKQPFKRVEELVKVKGFGKKKFEKMRPHLAVTGATTLRADSAAPAAQGRTPSR